MNALVCIPSSYTQALRGGGRGGGGEDPGAHFWCMHLIKVHMELNE